MTRQGSGERKRKKEEGLLCLNFVAGLENGTQKQELLNMH
jgi:hypothetical protein